MLDDLSNQISKLFSQQKPKKIFNYHDQPIISTHQIIERLASNAEDIIWKPEAMISSNVDQEVQENQELSISRLDKMP